MDSELDSKSRSSTRSATGGGIVFSATKCPPQDTMGNQMGGRLDQTCELPFGFCYTPMIRVPEAVLSSAVVPNLPSGVICTSCMSYLNLYCTTSELQLEAESNRRIIQWVCNLCQSDNIFFMETGIKDVSEDSHNDMDKIISQPVLEFRQSLIPESFSAAKSSTSSHSQFLPLKTIIVVIDENLTSTEVTSVGSVLRHILEQNSIERMFEWRLGLVVFGETISIFQLGASSGIVLADKVRSHEGFLVMTEVGSGYDIAHRSYLGTSIDILLTCLAAVFDLKENWGDVRSDAIHVNNMSTSTRTKKSRLDILKERKQARLSGIVDSMSQDAIEGNSSPWILAREQIARSKVPYRRTGDALQCAIELASLDANLTEGFDGSLYPVVNNEGSKSPLQDRRILLFTNGCPNLGDGSVVNIKESTGIGLAAYSTVDSSRLALACEFFDTIGHAAADLGVGIDVLCTGSSELGFPAYQSLAEPSSGYVLSHDTFSSEKLEYNIRYLLQQTHLSRSLFPLLPKDKPDTTEESHTLQHDDQSWIDGCIVDIRMSRFLTSTHLIGPGDLIEKLSGPLVNEQDAFIMGLFLSKDYLLRVDGENPSTDLIESTLTRIRIGRYDPLSTFSVMIRLNDLYEGEKYAFFQCIVRFIDVTGHTLVTRVTSQRLSVANDVGEFLEAIDEEIVPVLLGKEAVYRSMFGRDVNVDHPFHAAYVDELDGLAYDAQHDLDNTIFKISGAYRLLSLVHGTKSIDLTEGGTTKVTGSSMDFAFPPELSEALRRLYHLRRGPLLSPGPVQSADDRAEMRSLFVRLPFDDCLSMMAPSLWSSGSPKEALQSNKLWSVPPETLSLWQNRIIMADHWHNMFVWSGSETLISEFDVIRSRFKEILLNTARKRFPYPNLYSLTEADSMSRRFLSILGPSHGDPVEHQLAHFHELTVLSDCELAKLHSRFRFYDPEADPSFRKWFWDVASAASTRGTEGTSLCD